MLTVTVVMPCYNEAGRLQTERLLRFVDDHPQVTVVLVNDGSSDGTAALLDRLAEQSSRIHPLHLTENRGKANAVQAGFVYAERFETDCIGFLDADFDIPPEEILLLLESLERHPDAEFAFGSRIKLLNNTIERNVYRHLFGRVFATFTSNSLELAVYDTQCGVKLFRRALALEVFARPFISRWVFDVEVFWRVISLRGRATVSTVAREVPLRACFNNGASKISYRAMLKFPFELSRIKRHYARHSAETW
ncbi:MAG: glycosyltransferase [Flavobacteriales bacterium]